MATGGVTNWTPALVGCLLLAVIALLMGFSLFLIILAKIFTWLLVAIAPVIIILLLFGITSKFFSGWLSAPVQYFIVQVLVFAFLGFYISR